MYISLGSQQAVVGSELEEWQRWMSIIGDAGVELRFGLSD